MNTNLIVGQLIWLVCACNEELNNLCSFIGMVCSNIWITIPSQHGILIHGYLDRGFNLVMLSSP